MQEPQHSAGFSSTELASERAALLRDAILDSLSIPSPSNRESQITQSYSQTFGWIYKHDFGNWLSGGADDQKAPQSPSQSQCFWITGLPGSGKSTLMRYIHERQETKTRLRQWKDNAVTATFFFWESGTIMQRSQVGLLRSVLSQLMAAHPRLVCDVFPDLWSVLWTASTKERVSILQEWSIDQLRDALVRFFGLASRRPVFLLIDGLDELQGNQTEALRMLDAIRTTGNVKLLLSSRPWQIFSDFFVDIPCLRLQDLTAGDMQKYAYGRLTGNSAFRRLFDNDRKRAEALVSAALDKASGVFLWIDVAVEALLIVAASEAEVTWERLENRLGQFPPSLDDLYKLLLVVETADTDASLVMSSTFQLMRAREQVAAFTQDDSTSVMTMWEMVLCSMVLSSEDVAGLGIRQVPGRDVKEQCQLTYRTICDATARLVSLQRSAESEAYSLITYVHRTVKDWLAQPAVYTQIVSLNPSFYPHLAQLCGLILSFKESIEKPRKARDVMGKWPRIVLAMTHARFDSLGTAPDYVRGKETALLLDHFNEVLTAAWPRLGVDPCVDDWARTCFGTLEERGRTPFEAPFLSLAVKFGIRDYVERCVDSGSYEPGDGKSLLNHSVAYLCNRQRSLYPLSDPLIVRRLLSIPLNPNFALVTIQKSGKRVVARTPWQEALNAVQQADRRGWIHLDDVGNIDRWAEIIGLFLSHGADLTARAHASFRDTPESASDLLTRIVTKYPCPALHNLTKCFATGH